MPPERRLSGHAHSDDTSSEGSIGAQPLRTVFRVSAPGRKQEAVYHARRAHKKSRNGCLICKKRRVKCDEQRPHCRRCQSRGVTCWYASEPGLAQSGKGLDRMSSFNDPTTTFFSLSLENITRDIEETLSLNPMEKPLALEKSSSGHSISLVAFQHFVNCSTETIGQPAIRNVMTTEMIRVSFRSPHLMYTILGVGMLHLNRLSPSKERSFAESYFWQNAIQLYQAAISTPVRAHTVDALLSSCMLMGVMTICPENFEPTDSWVLTNKPEALNWLCLQSGLRCILTVAASYIPGSIWAAAFQETSREERKVFDQVIRQGRDGLDPDLADLCGIDDFTTEMTSIYYSPLRLLAPLMKLERNGPNAANCATFMGRLECDFLDLLRRRDPPALILLAHWMGLMCLLVEWQPWIEGRIRAECVAICMFLEHSTDPRVVRLLRFPADSCGYKLKSS